MGTPTLEQVGQAQTLPPAFGGEQEPPKPDYQALKAALKVGRRFRRQLAPFAVMAGTFVSGSVLTMFSAPWWAVLATGAVALGGAWWHTYVKAVKLWRRLYAAGVILTVTIWLVAAAMHGVDRPMPAWLAGVGGPLALPWWWRYRIRNQRPATTPTSDSGDMPEPMMQWDMKVSCTGGPLEHSRLLEVTDIRGGWSAIGKLTKGNNERAIMATKDIGAALGLRAGSIIIEPPPGGELDLFRVLVLPDNPLAKRVDWPGPSLNVTKGVSVLGWYADMLPVKYRHYRPDSGPVHDLISGSTDSGKSRTVEQLLAEERHSGVIISQVIDPQGGASLPDWQNHVNRYSRTILESRDLLRDARDRMYGRNALMAALEWTDDRGRKRQGIGQFTPGDPRHGLKMLSITIDEAQKVLADDVCRALVEEMIGMSRKCGIKFRLVTQVPLLTSLGNSMVIRDAVAAGNVLVLRTANRLSGQVAFNGALPVDPCSLPKEFPDGSTTSGLGFFFGPGADRASTMRVGYVEDPFHWATTGNPPDLEPFDAPAHIDKQPQPSSTSTPRTPADDEVDQRRVGECAVLAYLADHEGMDAARGEMVGHIQATTTPPPALRTITKALTDLTAAGEIAKTGRGMYRIADAGRARLEQLRDTTAVA